MRQYQNRVRAVALKKKTSGANKAPTKKAAPAKAAPAKAVAKKAAPAKVVAKKPAAIKSVAKKAAPAKAAPPKKAAPIKAAPVRPSLAKVTAPAPVVAVVAPPAEERRLVMPPPARPVKSGKKVAPLKPLKAPPTPIVVADSEAAWTVPELKAVRTDLAKELLRLKSELASVEMEMDELIRESGEGAGDDQADAGTKTFEREHEMSLVINARDMVLQTERALERIDDKTYGRCEECGNPIGKARLQVFRRATLCMACKQKEERR